MKPFLLIENLKILNLSGLCYRCIIKLWVAPRFSSSPEFLEKFEVSGKYLCTNCSTTLKPSLASLFSRVQGKISCQSGERLAKNLRFPTMFTRRDNLYQIPSSGRFATSQLIRSPRLKPCNSTGPVPKPSKPPLPALP